MKSNYEPIGKYIRLLDERNKGLQVQQLLGLSISKQFIPSVAYPPLITHLTAH